MLANQTAHTEVEVENISQSELDHINAAIAEAEAEAASKKRPAPSAPGDMMPLLRGEEKRSKIFFPLQKIISGGQTGADLAGLKAGRYMGLRTGGTAAPNFSTSAGRQDILLKSFGLTALPLTSSWSAAYCKRTMMNIDNANATVAFRVKESSGTD